LEDKLKKCEEENFNFKHKIEEIAILESHNLKLSQELATAKSLFEEVISYILYLNVQFID
jgi:hypothetical protein